MDFTVSESPDNPGVRIPPPLFYAMAIVLGLLFDGVHSLPIVTPAAAGSGFLTAVASAKAVSRIAVVVGWLLVAAWLYLTTTAFRLFRRKHTSVLPIRPSTTLVVAGPYRFTRNPMYLGLTLLTIALSLFLNTWWPIILLVPTLIVIQSFVIAREESYLRRRFGAEYDAYTCQVRRWL
jgi:protein-S-isoprenylcysteine O-methyltransferase Ste14